MNRPPPSPCDVVQPLLFASLEGQLGAGERVTVNTHVALCEACRRELDAERELNRMLGRSAHARAPARSSITRVTAAALLVIAVGYAGFAVLNAGHAYGSVETRTLTPMLAWDDGHETRLAGTNHIDIPTGSRVTITLNATGKLSVAGPAMFELDKGRVWKVTLLLGQLAAEVEQHAELEVVSLNGRKLLAAGVYVISLDPTFWSDAPAQATSPAYLFQRALREFTEATNLGAAEALLRSTLRHPDTDPLLTKQARFYLIAVLGNQGKFDEATLLQDEWLTAYPEDPARAHMLFFRGYYAAQLGDRAKARACWQEVLAIDAQSEFAHIVRVKLGQLDP